MDFDYYTAIDAYIKKLQTASGSFRSAVWHQTFLRLTPNQYIVELALGSLELNLTFLLL